MKINSIAYLVLMITLLLIVFLPNKSEQIIYQSNSQFGPLIVKERNDIRCLRFSEAKESLLQGCIKVNSDAILFSYVQVILNELKRLEIQPKHVLILGLGIGTLPKFLALQFQNAKIDIVEINSDVVSIAKQYFDFNDSSFNIIIEDGYKFVQTPNHAYDLIISDMFFDSGVKDASKEISLLNNLFGMLNKNGLIVMNILESSSSLLPLLNKYHYSIMDASANQIIFIQNNLH